MELLQEHHVEHIVDACLSRELEAVGHRANALEHLEGAEVAGCELGILAGPDSCRSALVKAEPHPVAHTERHIPVCRVMALLHDTLGLEELFPDSSQELIPGRQLLVQCSHL